jgi:hypothetical protein
MLWGEVDRIDWCHGPRWSQDKVHHACMSSHHGPIVSCLNSEFPPGVTARYMRERLNNPDGFSYGGGAVRRITLHPSFYVPSP